MSQPRTRPVKKFSKRDILTLLATRNDAVERAVLYLYKQQTADEQYAGDTKHDNGKGYNAADAKDGTYFAKWIINESNPAKPRKLTGRFLERARVMVRKYAGQLLKHANEPRTAKPIR